jgi:two-component system NtrC family sensor kinase
VKHTEILREETLLELLPRVFSLSLRRLIDSLGPIGYYVTDSIQAAMTRLPFRHWSVSRKILLGIVPLFLLFIALSVVINNYYQEQEMMEQAQVAAHTYADIIRESLVSMMVTNLEVDESFLQRVGLLMQFDTLHILINDLHLRPEAITPRNRQQMISRHKTLQPHDEIEREVLRTGQAKFTREGDHFRGVVPFNSTEVCQKCHAVPKGYTLGATDIHISLSQISHAASGNWKRSFILFLGFAVLAFLIASVLFARFVSHPVDRLVKATTEISSGNLDYAIVHDEETARVHSRDELEFLSLKFDAMRESLKEKIRQLDEANKSLAERNADIEQALAKLKQAQEELVKSERLAATGRMTAQLSHEINNPIHNIQSLLETSLRKTDGPAKELISLALEEVTRMAKLTRQMLDFYRGSMVEMEREPVDVEDVLRQVVREHEEAFRKQNIQVSLSAAPHLVPVHGSRDKLKQVFLNLILNARDAMPGGGTLSLRVDQQSSGVRISVSDTGIGIPPEHLPRIFDAFFTTKKEVSGVGLGLSVTYGIVQQHNGTLRVESAVGRGTTFTIELPIANEHDD